MKRRLLERQLSKRSSIDSSPEALSAFSAFVLGAVSKCIATCVTYPAIRYAVNPVIIPLAFHDNTLLCLSFCRQKFLMNKITNWCSMKNERCNVFETLLIKPFYKCCWNDWRYEPWADVKWRFRLRNQMKVRLRKFRQKPRQFQVHSILFGKMKAQQVSLKGCWPRTWRLCWAQHCSWW